MFKQILDLIRFVRTNAGTLLEIIREYRQASQDPDVQALVTEIEAIIAEDNQ